MVYQRAFSIASPSFERRREEVGEGGGGGGGRRSSTLPIVCALWAITCSPAWREGLAQDLGQYAPTL